MAIHSFVNFAFAYDISEKELIKLNRILKRIDSDAQEFNKQGYIGLWRKMLYSAEAFSDLIHKFGYANKVKCIENVNLILARIENLPFGQEMSYEEAINKEMFNKEWYVSKPSIQAFKDSQYSYFDRKKIAKSLNRMSRRFV